MTSYQPIIQVQTSGPIFASTGDVRLSVSHAVDMHSDWVRAANDTGVNFPNCISDSTSIYSIHNGTSYKNDSTKGIPIT